MKRFILFLLVGALLLLPLSGCFADKQNEGTTPTNTTENTTPEVTTPEVTTHDKICIDPPPPHYAMSAETPNEWKMANGDIPIQLSFGLKEGSSVDEMFSNMVFYAKNSEGQVYVFKKIDIAEIEKSEYLVKEILDENRQNVIALNYTHTETINLPLSLFSEDSGFVEIFMRDWVDDGTENGLFGSGAGVKLYYVRDNTNLIIAQEPVNQTLSPVGEHPFGEGPSTFMAPLFVQPPDLSWGPTLNIRVENDKIYINDYLYESVGILDNPQVSYTEALVWGLEVQKENSEIAETRETAANKLVILETIKNHTSCYVLETQANAKYGTKIAVFYIDGEYYLLNAVDEDVIRIWKVNSEQEMEY